MMDVREAVRQLLEEECPSPSAGTRAGPAASNERVVLLEFGGRTFEWQEMLEEELLRLVGPCPGTRFVRSHRYDLTGSGNLGGQDLAALSQADLLVTCTDSDEASPGTAVLQGAMCALGRPVWMYNSKRTAIRADGGYRSSRNLMLDYSADRTFSSLQDLATALSSMQYRAHDTHNVVG
jgi:hypothetical protein